VSATVPHQLSQPCSLALFFVLHFFQVYFASLQFVLRESRYEWSVSVGHLSIFEYHLQASISSLRKPMDNVDATQRISLTSLMA